MTAGVQATRCLEQEPGATFRLVDPVFQHTRARNVVILVANIMDINEAVASAVQDKAIAAQFEVNGVVPRAASPQEFGGWIKTSVDKLAQVVKAGDIRAD